MPWAKIDDRYWAHPKIRAAAEHPFALGMHSQALSYCAAYSTDGLLKRDVVSAFIGHPKRRLSAVARLVEIGLWSVCSEGWQIHDYLDYNPSAQEIRAQRQGDAERQAEYRARRNGVTPPLVTRESRHPDPSQPFKEEKYEREERRRPRRPSAGPTHDEANAAGLSWAARKRELKGAEEDTR